MLINLTKAEIQSLIDALEAFDVDPPVVPDLEVYYRALEKLKKAQKGTR